MLVFILSKTLLSYEYIQPHSLPKKSPNPILYVLPHSQPWPKLHSKYQYPLETLFALNIRRYHVTESGFCLLGKIQWPVGQFS